ncbi:MAG: hypothetical protein EHM61_09640 [Acidobacteria bacterium]|nr:MAG: hypothetical protein EHM61_09640 [Acidobacteriota bacterium]
MRNRLLDQAVPSLQPRPKRGGVGLDPELLYIGAQAQLGPVFRNLWFRPNFEFGFGEVTKITALNLEAIYFLPFLARGTGATRPDVWSIYLGGGPAAQLSRRSFEEGDVDIDLLEPTEVRA